MSYERQHFDWALSSLLNKVFCISQDNETITMRLNVIALTAERLPIYKIVSLNRSSYALRVPGKGWHIPKETERGVSSGSLVPCPPEGLHHCHLTALGRGCLKVGRNIYSICFSPLLPGFSLHQPLQDEVRQSTWKIQQCNSTQSYHKVTFTASYSRSGFFEKQEMLK